MSIYSIIVNCTYHDSKHIAEAKGIKKKKDYSCIPCWENAKFNEGTNATRFWKFYQTVFTLTYQVNSIIWQAFTQLISTITKKTPILDDEDLAKRLLLKLVKSIHYYYSSLRPVAKTTWII